MPLFAWDDPDASAGEDEHGENDEPEEDDQVELPTVDKIELKGAQEAYANTFDTDFDDDNVAMYAGFKEQGLSCASMEETFLPQEKRFRKTIDWVMKTDDARINGMCGAGKHEFFLQDATELDSALDCDAPTRVAIKNRSLVLRQTRYGAQCLCDVWGRKKDTGRPA